MKTTAQSTKKPYIQIFVSLAVLTIIEVVVAGFALPEPIRLLVLLGLAVAKALLVALYYMHLRYDHRILAVIGGFPLLLVVIMIIILMADRYILGA